MSEEVTLASYPGLDPRISVLRAGGEVDAVFVRTARFGVLVDTLSTPGMCARALALLADHLRDLPLLVVNSHMDWDHFWGNAAVAGAPIIAHETALKRLGGTEPGRVLAEMAAQEARFAGVRIIEPTITFAGPRMALHGGDLTLELLYTPGHTPDHVAVWIPELATCLAVDAVEDPIPEVWSAAPGDLHLLLRSLERIRDLGARQVLLAHGQSADPAVVERNLAYFRALVAAVTGAEGEVSDRRAGFQAEEFLDWPAGMAEQLRDFYRGFHRANLAAVVAARDAGVALF